MHSAELVEYKNFAESAGIAFVSLGGYLLLRYSTYLTLSTKGVCQCGKGLLWASDLSTGTTSTCRMKFC